jgi:mono/diheme cytochrome c family protein
MAPAHGFPVLFQGTTIETKTTAELSLHKIRVLEPYEKAEIEFEGYLLTDVLDWAYGKAWRKLGATHQIRMKCRDGYQLSVPLRRILEHQALLAIRRTDQSEFKILKKDVTPEKRMELAPAYLVWENQRDLTILAEGDYGWPFQWVEASLEPLGSGDLIPLPKKGASDSASRGFSEFKMHCLKCHSIGGAGGKVGPELHSPRNVTRYWRKEMLVEWLLDPASFRIPNGMPPLAPNHPNRHRIARDVVEYLASLAPSSPPEKGKP